MTESWMRLLDPASQPASLRETYELLEDFVVALRKPARIGDTAIDEGAADRLGYLVAAARLLAGAQVHESWSSFDGRMQTRRALSPRVADTVLLKADTGRNVLDELASTWGFRKGLDPRKLKEIVVRGGT